MTKPTLTTDVAATLAAQVAIATQTTLTPSNATPAAPEVAVVPRPALVELNGFTHVVMASVAHLSRLGYIPFPGIAPQVYANTGLCSVAMCLGSPDAYAVKLAEEAVSNAVAIQQRDHEKEIAEAAVKLVEKQAQEAKQAALAKEIAEQRAILRRLESQAA